MIWKKGNVREWAEETIKNHATRIFNKLGVAARVEAAVCARELGTF
jgi:DNA-binding NarL/FixJ family response regulator